ncbi:MAG TPA: alkaline phosphatase D family protein [Gaiellaceae bacterium]|nr:alkaline phosphatase D family protein [Gaiellaceae bacterium]
MSKIIGLILATVLLGLGAGGAGVAAAKHKGPAAAITHGVIVGDVTSSSALLWARADREATLNVVLSGGRHGRIARARAQAADDFTVRVPLEHLRPGTTYRYHAWFSVLGHGSSHGPVAEGTFRTAPRDREAAPLRLAFGGDLNGQNVCRDAAEGMPIMETVRARQPDVFVGLGDIIYADNACSAVGMYGNAQIPGSFGPATDLPTFRAHWRYTRADPGFQRLLSGTDYVGVWDDHEVVNDFGPLTDTRSTPPFTPGVHLMPLGLRAFLDYTPVAIAENTPVRLYRSLRWGKNLELFVLDTRQYRDPNFEPDTDAHPKTMLGREQVTWLKEKLAASDATWKVIVSSVPMSIPTGFPAVPNGRDGWANFDQATGYERELLDILRFMQEHSIRNTVWITTDVHFAEAFRYVPFSGDPGFAVHELVTGPMNAGIFPTMDFDTTLNPQRLAFFGPPSPGAVTTWTEAKRWFNFGELDLAGGGTLTIRIVNTAGDIEFERILTPS